MNQITSALVAAGVSLPSVQQRIWNYVKDHPCVTAKRVRTGLKLPEGTVKGLLSQMVSRGMMRAEKKHLRIARKDGYFDRDVLHYYVVGESYNPDRYPCVAKKTRLPAVERPSLDLKVALNKEFGPLSHSLAAPLPSDRQRPVKETIDALTVAQARELWLILNRMFGEQK